MSKDIVASLVYDIFFADRLVLCCARIIWCCPCRPMSRILKSWRFFWTRHETNW